jgi:hypothetical protein
MDWPGPRYAAWASSKQEIVLHSGPVLNIFVGLKPGEFFTTFALPKKKEFMPENFLLTNRNR